MSRNGTTRADTLTNSADHKREPSRLVTVPAAVQPPLGRILIAGRSYRYLPVSEPQVVMA